MTTFARRTSGKLTERGRRGGANDRGRLAKIKAWIDEHDVYEDKPPIIPFSGELELKLSTMNNEEKANYLKELNTTNALNKIIVSGYKALNLIYFFTAGEDEVRAWTIRVRDATAKKRKKKFLTKSCAERYQGPASRRCYPYGL